MYVYLYIYIYIHNSKCCCSPKRNILNPQRHPSRPGKWRARQVRSAAGPASWGTAAAANVPFYSYL